MEQKRQYTLFTALAMIVGIVIGSGIFFKTDNVLTYTSGNVFLGVIVFVVSALSIVFGSLSIAELAKKTDKPGGLIAYADEFLGDNFSSTVGWFQLFLYYPTLAIVVAWVVGIYGTALFGIQNSTLELQMIIGFCWYFICFAYNSFSAWFGGKFQEFATIVKLIPLFLIGFAAFFFGDPVAVVTNPSPEAIKATTSLAWLAAVGPIAFAFDGWVISTSIAHEIKNSKKNLPLALIIAPILILIGYLMYFVGISAYLGPDQVLEQGDLSVTLVASSIFGSAAAKALLVAVIISVMGTVNGVILGLIRLPYSMGLRNMLPFSNKLSIVNEKYDMPLYSAVFGVFISIFWWIIHYWTMKTGVLGGMDISEIAIVVSYLLYVVFYLKVLHLWIKKEIKSFFMGAVSPVLACVGSFFILLGGFQNKLFWLCLVVCLFVMAIGFLYNKIKNHR